MKWRKQPTVNRVRGMTVREFAEEYYFDSRHQTANTIRSRRHDLNRWERMTGDPVLGEIDSAVADQYRSACLDAGLAARTINQTWREIRAILRRAASPTDTNPRGLGMAFRDRLPWMEPVKGPCVRTPRRITLEEMSRVYVHGCKVIQSPRSLPYPVVDFWRTLCVVAWCTGLRRDDLWRLRWDQIDFENGTLDFTAGKTQKRSALFPLNAAALAHLSRIRNDVNPLVFCGAYASGGGRLSRHWRKISAAADVAPHVTLQQIRESAASEATRIRSGGGALLLQHADNSVTGRYYLQMAEELREIVDEMRLPVGFASGVKMRTRNDRERQAAAVSLRAHDFDMPTSPVAADWVFSEYGFAYRGALFSLTGKRLVLLRALVTSGDALSVAELLRVLQDAGYAVKESQVSVEVSQLRRTLCSMLGLDQWNPIPNVKQNGCPGAYAIRIPEFALKNAAEREATAAPVGREVPVAPDPDEWEFLEQGFAWRGRLFRLTGVPLWILRAFVTADDSLSMSALMSGLQSEGYKLTIGQTQSSVSDLRKWLRDSLALEHDPIICTGRSGGENQFAVRLSESALMQAAKGRKRMKKVAAINRADWVFSAESVTYRQRVLPLSPLQSVLLSVLVDAGGPVAAGQVLKSLKAEGFGTKPEQLSNRISGLRQELRRSLKLGNWNPVVCRNRKSAGCQYVLQIPSGVA